MAEELKCSRGGADFFPSHCKCKACVEIYDRIIQMFEHTWDIIGGDLRRAYRFSSSSGDLHARKILKRGDHTREESYAAVIDYIDNHGKEYDDVAYLEFEKWYKRNPAECKRRVTARLSKFGW